MNAGPAAPRVRANRLPWWLLPVLAAVPLTTLGLFYAWPAVTLVRRALGASALAAVLRADRTWQVLWFTTWQALLSTVLTLLVGLLPAVVVGRYRFPGRRLLDGALVGMFVLPTVVMAAAVRALLPDRLQEGLVAILVAHVLFNIAVVVRTVGATVRTLPAATADAAATLGAGPWRAFWSVTFPQLRAATIAAAGIVFVFTFGSFGVVRILGGVRRSTIEVEIWRAATRRGDVAAAAGLTLLQLVAIGAAVTASSWLQRRAAVAVAPDARARLQRPRRSERRLVAATVMGSALAIAVPLVALVQRSLRVGGRWSLTAWRTLGSNEIRPGLRSGVDPLAALTVSVRAMLVATVLTLAVGALASCAVAVAPRGGRLLDSVLTLPLATSAVTIGLGLLITFNRPPVDWRAEWWLVPIGHALVATPFVLRTVVPVLRSVPPGRMEAAATLGARPLRAWATVVLPHARRPLATAAALTAAISLGEFGASSFLSRSGGETMPVAIAGLLGRPGALPQAQGYALATLLAAATIAIVIVLSLLADEPEFGRA